jgi:hypothetical protein
MFWPNYQMFCQGCQLAQGIYDIRNVGLGRATSDLTLDKMILTKAAGRNYQAPCFVAGV